MKRVQRLSWLVAASFALTSVGAGMHDAGAQAKTLKIGFLYPVTGVFAAPGMTGGYSARATAR